tara:strand:- start:9921 stop:10292 length:372 start_codon:yes stop_codon:yes gene_type:complete
MGLKDRLRDLFDIDSGKLAETIEADEAESPEEKAQFMALAEDITNELLDEFAAEDADTPEDAEPILVSEYDAGDVDVSQLTTEEEVMSNHNEVNVVNHDSLDEIIEHLEGVEIIGDLPEEITF